MSLLRLWLIGTAVFLASVMVWAFVPILVPLFIVFVGLGGLVTLIVRAARAYERHRAGTRQDPDDPTS
ncbi:MAG: hypothetical protein J0J14_11060 [Hyphomicrobium sp.]|nr:hypothetical protein [Hyphomicrobium sp.]MBN9267938.1 hypothetical protein [Hyphomicrobium sp.]